MENKEGADLKEEKNWFFQHKLLTALGVIVLAVLFLGWLGRSSEPEVTPEQQKSAQADLVKLLEAAAKERIVADVKNPGTASLEILVGDGWYTLPYETKTKTLEAISLTHDKATGYSMLKARDYISGRIVGEVTAFGSIKIY